MASPFIHPAAIVESGAELAEDVYIGPFCTISAGARIGARTRLVSHVAIEGLVEMGEDNVLHPFCLVGGVPQDLSYKGEPTSVKIGHRNLIREGNSIHRGTAKDKAVTVVGNDNYLMGYCHIAHDCELKNNIIMANMTALAGHVQIGNFVNIGGQTGITQFVRVGDYAFMGAGSVIRRDLPPYMAAKEFSQVSGPNLLGLKRHKIADTDVRVAAEIYKVIYLGNQTTEKAMLEIEERFGSNPFARNFIDFVRNSRIGIQR